MCLEFKFGYVLYSWKKQICDKFWANGAGDKILYIIFIRTSPYKDIWL